MDKPNLNPLKWINNDIPSINELETEKRNKKSMTQKAIWKYIWDQKILGPHRKRKGDEYDRIIIIKNPQERNLI